ncbi:MAG: amidohydrolase [Alphaproteobacteria bacterium]|nr:amidohydrolase [Alphaproteobacteria bacterium]
MDDALKEALARWRRHLHAHPELSRQEVETASFIADRLRELGIDCTTGVGGHGVVATIARGRSNRSVGLRADMDALPITETTGLPYASANAGVMHACGHDGHTAALLGAAALLARDRDWTGTVQLVFQPAEEGAGGARAMLDDGLLERFPMERLFAFHNWPGLKAGTVMVHSGPVMAAGARIEIRVRGHAGHAAMPHRARDPMLASAHLLVALQSIVARNLDPLDSAVLSICTMEAGRAANQIPEDAVMRGTMRALNPDILDEIEAGIRRVSAGIAASFGMEAAVAIHPAVTVTRNTEAEAALAAEAAQSAGLPVRRDLPPTLGSEDFGWFLRRRPGAFVWIGNGEKGRELHNPGYDFNDAILPAAAGYLASVAKRALRV